MKKLLLIALVLASSLLQAKVEPEPFQAGVAYEILPQAQPTADSNKIEVVELFWYGCPHCHRFQPYIEQWLKQKPDNVVYIRMPAILRDDWSLHARAFYTAELLGVLDQIHPALFNAIHNEKRQLFSEQSLMAFFSEHGVNKSDFTKTFHSFAVDSKVRRAKQMTRRYRTRGTPSVIINGKYLSGPGKANGFLNLVKLIDYLVAKETKEMAAHK